MRWRKLVFCMRTHARMLKLLCECNMQFHLILPGLNCMTTDNSFYRFQIVHMHFFWSLVLDNHPSLSCIKWNSIWSTWGLWNVLAKNLHVKGITLHKVYPFAVGYIRFFPFTDLSRQKCYCLKYIFLKYPELTFLYDFYWMNVFKWKERASFMNILVMALM